MAKGIKLSMALSMKYMLDSMIREGAVTDTLETTNFHVICVLDNNCLGRVLGDKDLCSSMYALRLS